MRLRERMRSVGIAVMIATGTFSVLATSPPRAEVRDTARGEPFVLTRDHPVMTAVYRFDATPQVFHDVDSFGVNVLHSEIWSGVDDPIPSIEVTGRKLAGPSVPISTSGECGGSPRCVGTYEVTFAWPDRVRSGNVRVEWTVDARAGYDASEPPDGARVSVTIESMSGVEAAPHRFFEGSLAMSEQEPLITTDVRIASQSPIQNDARVALEIDPVVLESSGAAVALYQRDRQPIRLESGTATPLGVPARCARAACEFSITLVASLLPETYRQGTPVTWGLSSRMPLPALSASAAERSLLVLSRTSTLSPVSLQGNETWIVPALIEVPAAALPTSEFGPVRPFLQGSFEIKPLTSAVVTSDFARLTTLLKFSDAKPLFGSAGQEWGLSGPYGVVPASSFILPVSCSAGRPCRTRATVEFGVAYNEGGTIDVTPSFTLMLVYPRAESLPEGAGLDVTVGGEWTHVVAASPAA